MNSDNSQAVAARWAGAAALIGLASVVVVQAGAIIIAGQRVSGTSDADAIRAYFAHPNLPWTYLVGGAGFVSIVVLAVALRRYLRGAGTDPTAHILADAAAALIIVEMAVGAVELGLQSALVQLSSHAPGETGGILAVFAAWDWIYNAQLYWFEVGALLFVSWAAARTAALPGWLVTLGLLGAAAQVFNATVLVLGLPDTLSLPGNMLFAAWFASLGIWLLREAGRLATRSA